MPGRVFISCGQKTEEERGVATAIAQWFVGKGFDPYVAISTQGLLDVNSGIIEKLRASDYYVFIDFCRDPLEDGGFRGSLFSHQELAMAYLLEFEHCIFLSQEGVHLEGVGAYLLTNAIPFRKPAEILPALQHLAEERDWTPEYSRHLIARLSPLLAPVAYSDHTVKDRPEYVWHLQIHNKRSDLEARHTRARLRRVHHPSGHSEMPDLRPLKWKHQLAAYEQVIMPHDFESIDVLAVLVENPAVVYLHSLIDRKRDPILKEAGTYYLEYEVYAQNFPRLDVIIELTLDANKPGGGARIVPSLPA